MAIPQSSNGIGNLLRLSSLKNASGRKKILPGAEFLQDLENVPEDVSGVGSPIEEQNLPQPDLGGHLTPQSYDVRANEIMHPEVPEEENESVFTRLGRALGMKNREENEIQRAGIPDLNSLVPILQLAKSLKGEAESPENKALVQENIKKIKEPDLLSVPPVIKSAFGALGQNIPDTFSKEIQNVNQEEMQAKQQEIQSAIQNPDGQPVHGATEIVSTNPDAAIKFEQITGVNINDPKVQELTKAYEAILTGQENILAESQMLTNEQISRIKQRIESNSATDADKFYVGLALLMPLIVGGVFGAEAGLGALAGGSKGFVDVLGRRQENLAADEEALSALNKQRGELGLKAGELALQRAKLPSTIAKALPTNKHLIGREMASWTDPETGEQKSGVEILPGLIAPNKFLNNEKALATMVKSAEDILPVKDYTEEVTDLTDEFIQLAQQVPDKNVLTAGIVQILQGSTPGLVSRFNAEGTLNGRRVNLGQELDRVGGLLANAYGQAKKLGQMDKAAQNHIGKIYQNPALTFTTPSQAINEIIGIRDNVQNGLIRQVKNRGFEIQPVINELYERNRNLAEVLK